MEIAGVSKKLRPKASTSVGMGDSWWKMSVFLKPISSSWRIWRLALLKFSWCVFPERVPCIRVWSMASWAMLPLLSPWSHLKLLIHVKRRIFFFLVNILCNKTIVTIKITIFNIFTVICPVGYSRWKLFAILQVQPTIAFYQNKNNIHFIYHYKKTFLLKR